MVDFGFHVVERTVAQILHGDDEIAEQIGLSARCRTNNCQADMFLLACKNFRNVGNIKRHIISSFSSYI